MADEGEFEEFVRRYQDMVFGTAVRLLGDAREAEDVSQTVFMRAFERYDAISGSPAVAGWLRTVTRNLCLNHLTRFRSRWHLFSQISSRARRERRHFEDTLAAPESPAEDLERRQEYVRLERGIRSLPEHQRVPLVLFHFEERSYREIASLLHVTLSKVKTDIHRGRLALKSLMEAHDAAE